jgi:ABC-type glycerol-3-phosphate transport system substrate-binding protein
VGDHSSISRKELLRRGGLLAGTGALTAAGLGRTSASAAPLAVEASGIDVWANVGSPQYEKVLKLGATRLEKTKHVKANVQIIATTDYITKVQTAVAGGSPPDIAQIGTGAALSQLIAAKAIVPLDNVIKKGFPKFFPGLLADLSFNGKLYAIPVDANSLHVAYNKDIFKKYGLQPPKTLAQFIKIHNVLKSNGIDTMGAPIPAFAGADLFFQYVAYTDKTNKAIHLANAGKLSWTDPRFVKALGYVQQYATNELVNSTSWTDPAYDPNPSFVAQQLAMIYPAGNFATASLDQNTSGKFDWGVFPLPAPTAGMPLRSTGGAAVSFSLFADAKNPEAAIEYLQLLCDPKGKTALIQNQFIPSSTPPAYHGKLSPIYKYWLKWQKTIGTRFVLDAKVEKAILDGVVAMYTNHASPADVAKSMAAAAKA